jgi:putative cardiolipin synthase
MPRSTLHWLTRAAHGSVLGFLLLAGCVAVDPALNAAKAPSHALADPSGTELGRKVARAAAPHQGRSGFHLLAAGRRALGTRLALIERAQRTIDLQYYIFAEDETGTLVGQALRRAAQRGVRVRLLIDDEYTVGESDWLQAVDSAPNLELRIFNPFVDRTSGLLRTVEFLRNLPRLDHRMHNKLLLVDNTAAVIGGRNIENAYFGESNTSNYLDLDFLAVGPVVRTLSQRFDSFWNSPWAVPAPALTGPAPSPADLDRALRAAQAREAAVDPKAWGVDETALVDGIVAGRPDLVWAEAEVLYDPPEKAAGLAPTAESGIQARLEEHAAGARREVLIASPYFVPGEDGMRLIDRARGNGARVAVLTNSLAAADEPVVFVGYARYRQKLLVHGVELYELKPGDKAEVPSQLALFRSSSAGLLHAKVLVFDRRDLFVGSFNFDPRSRRLNTEDGLIVHSEALAQEAAQLVGAFMTVQSSFRVELVPEEADTTLDRGLAWETREQGRIVRYAREPWVGTGRRMLVELASFVTAENEL